MAEYIEREKAIEHIETHLPYRCSEDFIEGQKDCVEQLKSLPASDVVEVVHGEWVHIKDCGGGKCSGHCSVCWTPQEAAFPSALKEGFRYCRWCGAKMDGRKDV